VNQGESRLQKNKKMPLKKRKDHIDNNLCQLFFTLFALRSGQVTHHGENFASD
jgi:hypothetical protein